MPGPPIPPQALVLLKKYGWKAGMWVLSQVGADKLWKLLEAQLAKVASRQRAIRKAKQTNDGQLASALIDGQARWVVFSGDEALEAFPAVTGSLAEKLTHFDTSRLRRPDELRVASSRRWVAERLHGLRGRLRRHEDEAPQESALQHGEGALKAMTAELPALLNQLTSALAQPVKNAELPEAAGVFLLSEGPNPLLVRQTRNLRGRLATDTGQAAIDDHHAFVTLLAEEGASAADGSGADGQRGAASDDALVAARQRVEQMEVRHLELADPLVRTSVEVFVTRALDLTRYADFRDQ